VSLRRPEDPPTERPALLIANYAMALAFERSTKPDSNWHSLRGVDDAPEALS
jgi:hypothetical protein